MNRLIFLTMLLTILSCSEKKGYEYIEIGVHEGIGEKYTNNRDDFSLDLKFPVLLGHAENNIDLDFFKLPLKDIRRIEQFHFHFKDRYFTTASIYANQTIDMVISDAFAETKKHYPNSNINVSSYEQVTRQNKCIKGTLVESKLTYLDFFYHTKTDKIFRFTFIGKLPSKTMKYLELDFLDMIQPLMEGQKALVSIPDRYIKNNFDAIRTLNDIRQQDNENYFEAYAHILNCVGSFPAAQSVMHQQYQNQDSSLVSEFKSIKISKIIDAKSEVIRRLSSKSILHINENHYNPQSRIFLRKILPELINQGFTNLACEGFSGIDGTGFREVESIKKGLGFYTNESEFGNLLREFNRLGGKMYGYSPSTSYLDSKRKKNREQREASRDSVMFENIEAIYQKCLVKKEKLIIFSGHAHNHKKPDGIVKRLGYYLDQRYREDVLVVDQSFHLDNYLSKENWPIWYSTLDQPSIVYKETEFIPQHLSDRIDLFIMNPPLENMLTYSFDSICSDFKIEKSKGNNYFSIYEKGEFESMGNKAIPLKIVNSIDNTFAMPEFSKRKEYIVVTEDVE